MRTADALRILGLELPRIQVKTHYDAHAELARWKARTLRSAFRTAARTAHPDHGGTDAAMREVLQAYDKLKGLRVRPPRTTVRYATKIARMRIIIRDGVITPTGWTTTTTA